MRSIYTRTIPQIPYRTKTIFHAIVGQTVNSRYRYCADDSKNIAQKPPCFIKLEPDLDNDMPAMHAPRKKKERVVVSNPFLLLFLS